MICLLSQIKTQLAEKEKQLENERQVNKQLRVQVVSVLTNMQFAFNLIRQTNKVLYAYLVDNTTWSVVIHGKSVSS